MIFVIYWFLFFATFWFLAFAINMFFQFAMFRFMGFVMSWFTGLWLLYFPDLWNMWLKTHCVPDPSMSFHKAATYSDPCHLMPLINKWHATYSKSAVVDHCLVAFTVQRASALCGQWFGDLSFDFVSVCKCFFIFHWFRFPCLTCSRAKQNVVVALPSIHATSTWNLCGGISGDFVPKVKLSLR